MSGALPGDLPTGEAGVPDAAPPYPILLNAERDPEVGLESGQADAERRSSPASQARTPLGKSGLRMLRRLGSSLTGSSASSFSLQLPKTAFPQVVAGEDVWPEYWGITRQQVRELLVRLRSDAGWNPGNNVYQLVDDYVRPWTQGGGVGYALQQNAEKPKEVNVMVSHAWGENAEEFLEALLRSTSDTDVLFVCALSLYQGEDDAGPSIPEQLGTLPGESPFRRVLEHIRLCGLAAGCRWSMRRWLLALPLFLLVLAMLSFYLPVLLWGCAPALTMCAATTASPRGSGDDGHELTVRSWYWEPISPLYVAGCLVCLILAAVAAALGHCGAYAGRMIVVPNRELDIYSRLWCVYEIFIAKTLGIDVVLARTLASAAEASTRLARCSSATDTMRINSEIAAGGYSYTQIDRAVYVTLHRSWWTMLRLLLLTGTAISFFDMAYSHVGGPGGLAWQTRTSARRALEFGGILLGQAVARGSLYRVFARAQGEPELGAVLGTSGVLVIVGLCPLALGVIQSEITLMSLGLTMCLSASSVAVIAITVDCFPGCVRLLSNHPNWAKCCFACCAFAIFAIGVLRELSTVGQHSVEAVYAIVLSTSGIVGHLCVDSGIYWYAAACWGLRIRSQKCP